MVAILPNTAKEIYPNTSYVYPIKRTNAELLPPIVPQDEYSSTQSPTNTVVSSFEDEPSHKKLRSGRPCKRGDGLDEVSSIERKRARAIRNRIAARKSRDKKKSKVESLDDINKTLRDENQRLRQLLDTSEQRRIMLENHIQRLFSMFEHSKSFLMNNQADSQPSFDWKDLNLDFNKPTTQLVTPSRSSSNTLNPSQNLTHHALPSSSGAASDSNSTYSEINSYNGDLCESAVLVQFFPESNLFTSNDVDCSVLKDFLNEINSVDLPNQQDLFQSLDLFDSNSNISTFPSFESMSETGSTIFSNSFDNNFVENAFLNQFGASISNQMTPSDQNITSLDNNSVIPDSNNEDLDHLLLELLNSSTTVNTNTIDRNQESLKDQVQSFIDSLLQ
ncbi:hypothetical protein BB559_001717 [Furculomyces boomerangus]|uniref:BZIP domain-containing protein n=2 Tax=Harpellales TaxID=61421 RepID=A0A2T9Z121_9FUNG|nr:hypothetical protein BB559_001717 [Furculomyces boomerangus]PVZ96539.1 hypothetical protein BB558_007565 [Smittium angustum]